MIAVARVSPGRHEGLQGGTDRDRTSFIYLSQENTSCQIYQPIGAAAVSRCGINVTALDPGEFLVMLAL